MFARKSRTHDKNVMPRPRLTQPAYDVSACASLLVVGNFDQVSVGITKIHREYRAGRAGPRRRTFDDLHAAFKQVPGYFRQRCRRDQANVSRPGNGGGSLGFELPALLMQIDFRRTEMERPAAIGKSL